MEVDAEKIYSIQEYFDLFPAPLRCAPQEFYNNSINKLLLECGLPKMGYFGSSTNKIGISDRNEITKFVVQNFALLNDKVQDVKVILSSIKVNIVNFTHSQVLTRSRCEGTHANLYRDAHEYVRDVAYDVHTMMGYTTEYYVVKECSHGAGDRKDVWAIRAADGTTMFIVIVKRSFDKTTLENWNVLGEGFDFITNISASSSRRVLFCVLTTYDYWRIVWLPDTTPFVARDILWNEVEDGQLHAQNIVDLLARELHGSKIYAHDDPELLPALMTVMWKSVHSPFRPVKLIELDRLYIYRDQTVGTFKTLSPDLLTPSAQYPNESHSFYFIRDYRAGADGRVWLAGTENGCLVILKFHFDEETRVKEKELWERLYGVELFTTTLYPDSQVALVLPVAIHCQQREDGVREFNANVATWTSGHEMTRDCRLAANDDTVNWRVNPFIADFATLTPSNVLQQACEKLIAKGKVHGDLEWRHLALLPRYTCNVCTGMDPILLDLAQVEDSTEETLVEFREKMKQLLHTA